MHHVCVGAVIGDRRHGHAGDSFNAASHAPVMMPGRQKAGLVCTKRA